MDDDKPERGQARRGGWLGDYEDLVGHDDAQGDGDHPLPVRKLWNPVTYRCAFCGASFMSRAMIGHHLERHHRPSAGAGQPTDTAA
jgi:hypothetical protein